jgi:hypothetical protein
MHQLPIGGLLLTSSIDHLFDRGFIGFEDNGELIISPVAHRPSLDRMGIETKAVVNVGGFRRDRRTSWTFTARWCYSRPRIDYHARAALCRVLSCWS